MIEKEIGSEVIKKKMEGKNKLTQEKKQVSKEWDAVWVDERVRRLQKIPGRNISTLGTVGT